MGTFHSPRVYPRYLGNSRQRAGWQSYNSTVLRCAAFGALACGNPLRGFANRQTLSAMLRMVSKD